MNLGFTNIQPVALPFSAHRILTVFFQHLRIVPLPSVLHVFCINSDYFPTCNESFSPGCFQDYFRLSYQIWQVFCHYFFKYFFLTTLSSFSRTSITQMLDLLISSHCFLSLYSFVFQSFSPLCCISWIISLQVHCLFPLSSLFYY